MQYTVFGVPVMEQDLARNSKEFKQGDVIEFRSVRYEC